MMSKNEITTAEFKKFLYSFKDEGNFNTHVGMLEGMRGTFQFNRKGIEQLYDIIGDSGDNVNYGYNILQGDSGGGGGYDIQGDS